MKVPHAYRFIHKNKDQKKFQNCEILMIHNIEVNQNLRCLTLNHLIFIELTAFQFHQLRTQIEKKMIFICRCS